MTHLNAWANHYWFRRVWYPVSRIPLLPNLTYSPIEIVRIPSSSWTVFHSTYRVQFFSCSSCPFIGKNGDHWSISLPERIEHTYKCHRPLKTPNFTPAPTASTTTRKVQPLVRCSHDGHGLEKRNKTKRATKSWQLMMAADGWWVLFTRRGLWGTHQREWVLIFGWL